MIARLLSLPNDDARKIVFVALSLCLVCSLVVSSAAVLLGPLQKAEQELNRKRNVLFAAGLLEPGEQASVTRRFRQVEQRVVDLETGRFVDDIDPNRFDARAAARDPAMGIVIDPPDDLAGLGRRSRYQTVYVIREDGDIRRLILPVSGMGLWSTMHAYIALEGDLNTVASVNFYEHAETPGLGAEIESPKWQSLWEGKLVYDESGEPRLRVIKGTVNPASDAARFQIDGIAGSTLTGNGVTNMIRYWFGPQGYGPLLDRLRRKEA